jgi:PAS domain S-box-containing protein
MKETKAQLHRYQALMRNSLDGVHILDIHGDIVEANDVFCDMLGYTRQEAGKLNIADWDAQWSGDEVLEKLKNSIGESARFETVHRRKDGKLIDVEISAAGVDIDGQTYFFASSREITGRKVAEAKIRRLTQLYAALSQCNKAIVHCASEEELFHQICRIAVESGGMQMTWIGLVDGTSQRVKPVASYGAGAEYLDGIHISVDPADPFGRGPTGTAIRDNRPYWNQDFRLDPNTAPWRERGERYGWRSSAALPLLRSGIPVGSITLYSSTVNAFDEEARKMLAEMATDISFALDNFEHKLQRKRDEEEIIFKNTILQTQQETSLDALLIVDENARIISCNQLFVNLWRIPPQLINARVDAPVLQSVVDQTRNPEDFISHVQYLYGHREEKSHDEVPLKDGRIIDRYSAPITGADGKYYGRVWYFRDITESRLAEQKLVDSEQRFRSLVERSLAGIYIIQDGRLVYVNPRTAEILGQGSTDDLTGRELVQFVTEADRGRVVENMRRLNDKDVASLALEFEVLRKDGVTVTVGANASLATYHDLPAILGLIQDISEKKHDAERIQNYIAQLKAAFLSTVQLATSLSEMRDPYTAGHERRVSEIAVAVATELGLDEQRIEAIRIAGYLHDIGKISIPAEILVKPGRLNATEYALVQGHAQASYDVLKSVPFPWPIATIALQHHERMDGSGYPNKLKGDEIMLESRIMAVADVVEAMASHRPYRPGLGIDKALAEIERGSGTSYDPVVADACLRLFREHGYVLPPL